MIKLYPREIYIMKSKVSFCIFAMIACFGANAQDIELDNALRETYVNCVGIDDALHDMKVKAGINTAVTGVGTGLGIGAVATGIAKAKTDETLQQKFDELKNLAYTAHGEYEEADKEKFKNHVRQRLFSSQTGKNSMSLNQDTRIQELTAKSKKLGNWRTGLLTVNTATNVAGAAIAGTNKVNKSLEEQIDNCKTSVKNLKNEITRAKFNGEDISEAQDIASACGEFEYIDFSKIDNRAKGSMTSSIVGASTGVVGTITSALANSDRIRNNDSASGQKKEKTLNTSANVLAAGSTVASATATIFNAAQIKAIKDVAEIASKCTGVLK